MPRAERLALGCPRDHVRDRLLITLLTCMFWGAKSAPAAVVHTIETRSFGTDGTSATSMSSRAGLRTTTSRTACM